MGRFSTTLNIKSADFANAFTELMKKRGFETCKADEASLSYLVAQGEKWATCACGDYNGNPQHAGEDAELFANELNAPVIFVEVVDSDFAILKTNGDEVIAGDGSGYGIEVAPKGTKAIWEPLLESGTFEELAKILGANEVFVEDALCKAAPLLGIEPSYICADYRDLSESDDRNITALCFKKIGAGKPMTLNAGFIKVFGEGLEPLGFKRLKKIKNKYPFFVRVVNGDILHVVSYRQVSSPKVGYKNIEVYCGVVTLYRREIDFTIEPVGLLANIFHLFQDAVEWGKIDSHHRKTQSHYLCKADDNDVMLQELVRAFNDTTCLFPDVIDKVTNLDACVDYFYNIEQRSCSMNLCPFDEFVTNDRYSWSEALLLVKTRNMDDGVARFKKMYKDFSFLGPRATQEDIEKYLKKRDDFRVQQYAYRLEMINDPELNKRVLDEMERCKANNVELLRSYGLDI